MLVLSGSTKTESNRGFQTPSVGVGVRKYFPALRIRSVKPSYRYGNAPARDRVTCRTGHAPVAPDPCAVGSMFRLSRLKTVAVGLRVMFAASRSACARPRLSANSDVAQNTLTSPTAVAT